MSHAVAILLLILYLGYLLFQMYTHAVRSEVANRMKLICSEPVQG